MVLLSKPLTIPTTCQEYVHPWTDSCFGASFDLMFDVAQESLKIYVTAYLIALLMKGRLPSKKDIKRTIFGILQSSLFLTTHGIGYSIALCSIRRLLGHFNILTVSFIPSFVSSIVAILIERPSRRGLLSLYVTNVASETVFRMAVRRNLFKPIPYGEVAIFSASISLLLYFFRGEHASKDPLYTIIRFLVGPYEESDYSKPKIPLTALPPQLEQYSGKSALLGGYIKLLNWWKQAIFKLKTLPSDEKHCPHPYSCPYYVVQGGGKMFALGYSLQLAIKIALNFNRIMKNPKLLGRFLIHKETFQLGTFCSLFSMLFRGVSCGLRRYQGKDTQYIALPAGLIAGMAFFFYRGNTIALYFMWKAFQIVYNKGVAQGHFINIPYASVFFHAFSTAVLFHVAILEPQNLRPSYWKFLMSVSGERVMKMDRKCVDVFGLQTSKYLAQVIEQSQRSHK